MRGGWEDKIEQRKYAQFTILTKMATAVNGFFGSMMYYL